MRLGHAVEALQKERPDLALALKRLLPEDSAVWDLALPDDAWNHDVFEDAEEEYQFLKGIITGEG